MKFLYLSLVILSLIGRLLFIIGTIYIGYRIFLWAGGGFVAFFVGIFAAGFLSPILYLPLIGIDMLRSYIARHPSSGARENRAQRRALVRNRPLPVHSHVEPPPTASTAVSLEEFLKHRGQTLEEFKAEQEREAQEFGEQMVEALKRGIKEKTDVN